MGRTIEDKRRPFRLKRERGKGKDTEREKNGEGLKGNGRRLRKGDRCSRQIRTACSLLWDDPTDHRGGHDHTAQAYPGSVAEPSLSEARERCAALTQQCLHLC